MPHANVLLSFVALVLCTHLSYCYEPVIVALIPDHSPAEGSVEVQVTGVLFNETSPFCSFDGTLVPAKFTSSTIVSCTAPPVTNKTSYIASFRASNDGTLFSLSKNFYYFSVFSISPDHGNIVGKTVVTVTGINFEGLYECKFDNTVVAATVINSTTLTCVSPQGNPNARSVPVEVSSLVYATYTTDNVQFTYEGDIPVPHTDDTEKSKYKIAIVSLSVLGITFIFGMFFLLGWCVSSDKKRVVVVERATLLSVNDE